MNIIATQTAINTALYTANNSRKFHKKDIEDGEINLCTLLLIMIGTAGVIVLICLFLSLFFET